MENRKTRNEMPRIAAHCVCGFTLLLTLAAIPEKAKASNLKEDYAVCKVTAERRKSKNA
jgi:hypothetical protein